MWMHEVELGDGTAVHAYKQQATRRYFHLATDGRAFTYTASGTYLEISREQAIRQVFTDWAWIAPEPEPGDLDLVREAAKGARQADA